MLTLAELITADPQQIEADLVEHYREACAVCRATSARQWHQLCTRHAYIVRALVDPTYFEHLKARTTKAQHELAELDQAIQCKERIATGEAWLKEQTDPARITAGEERLGQLHQACPARYADVPAWQLLNFRGQVASQAKFYESRLQAIRDASPDLQSALARAQ